MGSRTHGVALALSLALPMTSPATAQTSGATLVESLDSQRFVPPAAGLPQFRAPQGDLREAGEVRRNGLIAAFRVRDNLQIGVGRFAVPEIARPRTNMERDRHPTAVRPRDRGIAAIGFSLSF